MDMICYQSQRVNLARKYITSRRFHWSRAISVPLADPKRTIIRVKKEDEKQVVKKEKKNQINEDKKKVKVESQEEDKHKEEEEVDVGK